MLCAEILQKALNVTFDRNVGHSYLEDFEKRFEFYHTEEEKLPFDIELLNDITNGGLSNKTLNIILGGNREGVQISGYVSLFSGAWLTMGKNVLYITAEMSEEKIAERIDANLLDVPYFQKFVISQRICFRHA